MTQVVSTDTAWAHRWLARVTERNRTYAERLCKACGKPVGYSGYGLPKVFCRKACNPGKRIAGSRRRALERGVTAERFDPIEVLRRDGWRCHLCGVKTPERLRGLLDPRAPQLDHIVPIAAGGEHTRLNTACACRRCNMAKGAKPKGQMRLIA